MEANQCIVCANCVQGIPGTRKCHLLSLSDWDMIMARDLAISAQHRCRRRLLIYMLPEIQVMIGLDVKLHREFHTSEARVKISPSEAPSQQLMQRTQPASWSRTE